MDRKLFVEVADEAHIPDLEHAVFVPTRLAWNLGEELTLGLRFPHCERALEVPVIVVGRRLPRGHGLLSGGVMVKLAHAESSLLDLIHDISHGHADVAGRLQERKRLPARLHFGHRDQACDQLCELLGSEGCALALRDTFVRGDRIALDLVVGSDVLATIHVQVTRIQVQDGEVLTVVAPLDAVSRSGALAALGAKGAH